MKSPRFRFVFKGKEHFIGNERVWPLLADESSYWKVRYIFRANIKYLKTHE